MFSIERKGVSFFVREMDNKYYLWIENEVNTYLVGRIKDKQSAEMLRKTVNYVCFGDGEEARTL